MAVATLEGALVNLHLGEARSFQIWGQNGDGGFSFIEERQAPPPGGFDRWWKLAETLHDCRAVLVSAIGEIPREVLTECGVIPWEVNGFIDLALQAVSEGRAAHSFKARQGGLGKACSGKGGGGGCL